MSSSLNKKNLLDILGLDVALFIGHASFEDRCLTLAEALKDHCSKAVVFSIDQFSAESKSNLKELSGMIGDTNVYELNYSDPILSADVLMQGISESFNPSLQTVVDITTFTRENLLMLMKVLHSSYCLEELSNLYFVYNCASEMSKDWLSRGVSEQRSILGFSGQMLPSHNTHLIILMGFEIDKARYLIDAYEPYSVSIGFGHRDESISEDFHRRNIESIETLIASYSDSFISNFDFSLVDPKIAAQCLNNEVQKYRNFNIVLAPQNNKISSVAAGIFGLSNPELQITYTKMEEYNYIDYSKPSDQFYLFRVSDLYG